MNIELTKLIQAIRSKHGLLSLTQKVTFYECSQLIKADPQGQHAYTKARLLDVLHSLEAVDKIKPNLSYDSKATIRLIKELAKRDFSNHDSYWFDQIKRYFEKFNKLSERQYKVLVALYYGRHIRAELSTAELSKLLYRPSKK